MENEILKHCAYHESGRVVFAYKCGYQCDSIELSATDAGNGHSKLNGGNDLNYIQAIFSGGKQEIIEQNPGKAIEVARKLMKISCAGACAANFLSNGLQFVPNTELEVPSQDIRYIDLIEGFLKATDPNHPESYVEQTMQQIFDELQDKETWKAIDTLAKAAIENTEPELSAFYIEDALMGAGLEFKGRRGQGGVAVGLSNEDVKKPAAQAAAGATAAGNALAVDVMLDMVLSDFMKKIRKDWDEEELQEALAYLKNVFNKFKQF